MRVHVLGMLPEIMLVSEAGSFVVDDAGKVTKEGKAVAIAPFMFMTVAEANGETNGTFMNLNNDIRSELTGPTVDADNKNERFSSSVYLWN